jgi:hypothetical protein
MIEDDNAPPELEGAHVELVFELFDGEPRIIQRRPVLCPPVYVLPKPKPDELVTQDIPRTEDTGGPYRLRDLIAAVRKTLLRNRTGT